MMNFDTAIDLQVTQRFANGRMLNFINFVAALDLRINHPNSMLEKRRKKATSQIAVFVNGRRQHGAAMLPVPRRIIGSAAEKGDAIGRSSDNHGRSLRRRCCSRRLGRWRFFVMQTRSDEDRFCSPAVLK